MIPLVRALPRPVAAPGPAGVIALALVVLLLAGGLADPRFFSPAYLLQQLHTGAFLGVIAIGAMVVILTGHIDLSVPWTLSAAATFSTAFVGAAGEGAQGELGLLVGLAVGAGIGLVNGIGVAYLRLPSMIWTLAVNMVVLGVCVLHAGLYASGSRPSAVMATLGGGWIGSLVPNAVVVWMVLSAAAVFLLRRTVAGRCLYAVGTRESAAWLSGIDTRRVLLGAFVISGLCSAVAGMLLAGYANQAYQRMGDPYLLPGIAAVVLGGTSILGGRGSYGGCVAGVLLITLITSMLSLLQVPEAFKQIAYGGVIILMVGYYSRRAAAERA
ncbi:ABC transporter permease [Azospirillum halopraeferens]|uniref:ABC transporter permease n=1 Tax=Azospirillum halopraeferens TaxID=34010 RepID=UPI00040C4917|nr:ABC transporter permease [Azospirillum halopraeferens]